MTTIDQPSKAKPTFDDEAIKLHFEIAQSLASDYESIYRVNLETGKYMMYSSAGRFESLDMQTFGNDFFADAQRDAYRVVYKDDQDLMSKSMRRETLMKETSDGAVFRFDYRLLINGAPAHYNCKVVRSVHDDSNLIIGISNIDRQKERELEYAIELQHARDLAQRDELTGVRNRNAFIQMEAELDLLIAAGTLSDFALVICDLNDLKAANDKLGHAAGDALIRNACHTICSIFDHSPVFRIGGDEFLCVLRDHDYAYRAELFAQLGATSAAAAELNREAGVAVNIDHPVIACGMSVFNPATDVGVSSVFERADKAMYDSKQRLKDAE